MKTQHLYSSAASSQRCSFCRTSLEERSLEIQADSSNPDLPRIAFRRHARFVYSYLTDT